MNLKQLKAQRRRLRQKEKKRNFIKEAAKREHKQVNSLPKQSHSMIMHSEREEVSNVPSVGKIIKFDHVSFDSLGVSVKSLEGVIMKISDVEDGSPDEKVLLILLKTTNNTMNGSNVLQSRSRRRITALTGNVEHGEMMELKWSEIINPQIY